MKKVSLAALGLVSLGLTLALAACGDEGVSMYGHSSVLPAPTPLELFNTQCAGCHGTNGGGSGARALDDARWWATITDAQVLAAASHGVGVMMPALAVSAGGMVPDATLSQAIPAWRSMWGEGGSAAPQGWAVQLGDAKRGEQVFASHCASCHAIDRAGGITDPIYLALVSDQALWSGVVFGRPDLGKQGMDLSAREVADVVSWLASRRPTWATGSFGGATQ